MSTQHTNMITTHHFSKMMLTFKTNNDKEGLFCTSATSRKVMMMNLTNT